MSNNNFYPRAIFGDVSGAEKSNISAKKHLRFRKIENEKADEYVPPYHRKHRIFRVDELNCFEVSKDMHKYF